MTLPHRLAILTYCILMLIVWPWFFIGKRGRLGIALLSIFLTYYLGLISLVDYLGQSRLLGIPILICYGPFLIATLSLISKKFRRWVCERYEEGKTKILNDF